MCDTCDTYEIAGFGGHCPCKHVDGKCVEQRSAPSADTATTPPGVNGPTATDAAPSSQSRITRTTEPPITRTTNSN